MIPRIIHQIWYQGADQVPSRYHQNTIKLRQLNPEWQYMIWDNISIRQQCVRLGPSVVQSYDEFEHMHQKVDFGRYVVLFLFGGMSVDMDVAALLPLNDTPGINSYDLIVSETPLSSIEVFFYSFGRFTSLINNAMILCIPSSPHIKHLINKVVNHRKSWRTLGKMYAIQWSTGPFQITESLQESGDAGVKVLPYQYFEPCYSNNPHCRPDGISILDHQHATSWVDDRLIRFSKGYYSVKPHLPIILFLVLTAWLLRVRQMQG